MNIEKVDEADNRRRKENTYLSTLVDLGVTYRKTLGDKVAQAFLFEHGVPADISARILDTQARRRLTDWEAVALERVQEMEIKS